MAVDRSLREEAFHLTTTKNCTTAKAAGRGFGLLAVSTTTSNRIDNKLGLGKYSSNSFHGQFHTLNFRGHQAIRLNS
jgi:hypothetical protein